MQATLISRVTIYMKSLSVFFIALQIFTASCFSEEEHLKDNIIIVLDASGSMSNAMGKNNRLQVAKEAITTVVQTMSQQSNLGILVFSGSGKDSDWLHQLGPINMDVIKNNLKRLAPSGGTPLGNYMKKARYALEAQRQKQLGYGTYRMLILTDGEASDHKFMMKETPIVLNNGIYLDVIGVAMKNNHTLAKRANSYRSAMDQNALMQAVKKVLSEVNTQSDQKESQEMFTLLEPLNHDIARVMIQGLGSNRKELDQLITQLPADPKAAPVARQSPPGEAKPKPSTKPKKDHPNEESNSFGFYILVFAAFVYFFLLRKK